MLMSRRSMLALMASVAAGGAIARLPGAGAMAAPVTIPALPLSPRNYQGMLLKNWHVAVGDGLYTCDPTLPVTLDDIETVLHGARSVLQANVEKRCVMAHNITFLRIRDDDAFKYTHRCGYKFRIPYEIVDDVETDYAAETVEGGLFIWDGDKILDAEAYDYGVAFQVVINPWSPDYGKLFFWQGVDEWSESDVRVVPGTVWHHVQMSLDFQDSVASLSLDGLDIPVTMSKTTKTWGGGVDARLQVETVSKKPIPEGVRAMSEVDVTDWDWTWSSESVNRRMASVDEPSKMLFLPMTSNGDWIDMDKILTPARGETVVSPIAVRWMPDDVPMTVQVCQNEELVSEHPNSSCGASIAVGEPGPTEIKIWKPGAAQPLDSVTVNVTDDPQSIPWEIASPVQNQTVESPISVCWRPECGEMVVQLYRDEQMIAEKENATSGDQFEVSGEGEVEFKIWVPGAAEPADSLWVHLIDDGSHKLPI